jgi:hypothetical protein
MKSRLPRVRASLAPFLPFDTDPRVRHHAEADERGDGADAMGMGSMFSDPRLFAKLAANPRTAKHLADGGFMQKVCARCAPEFALTLTPSSPSSSSSYSRIHNWRRPCSAATRA